MGAPSSSPHNRMPRSGQSRQIDDPRPDCDCVNAAIRFGDDVGNTTIIAVWAWGLRPSRGSGTAQLQNVVTVSCMLTAGSEMRSNVVCNSVSSLSSEGVWLDLEKRFKGVKRALSEAVRESGRRGGTDETSHHGSVPVLRSGGVCVRVNVRFVSGVRSWVAVLRVVVCVSSLCVGSGSRVCPVRG